MCLAGFLDRKIDDRNMALLTECKKAMATRDPSDSVAPRRRWLRFSLRTFLIVVTLFGAWLGIRLHHAEKQKRAVEALEVDGNVRFAHQRVRDLKYRDPYDLQQELGVPIWLRKLAGDDFFQRVSAVYLFEDASDDDLIHLAPLDSLELLRFVGGAPKITDAGLSHLPRPDRLVILSASGTSLGDQFVKRLAGAKRLQHLGIGWTQVTDESFRTLRGLDQLTILGIRNTAIGDVGLEALQEMTSLERLQLEETRVTDAGLVNLVSCRSLVALRLDNTAISDAGLAHLAQLSKLRLIGLHGTRVRGPGLVHVAPHVRSLILNGTPLDDEGLKHLSAAKGLERLSLEETAITDAGLAHLHGLAALRFVSLYGAAVTAEGIRQLKQAIPGLIVRVDAPEHNMDWH
jgi:hypothetical protein